MPALGRLLRGTRRPGVLLGELKLTCRPFLSASVPMPESVLAMNTDWKRVSSSRRAIGTILPPERSFACAQAKPPNHTRPTVPSTRASTAAGWSLTGVNPIARPSVFAGWLAGGANTRS